MNATSLKGVTVLNTPRKVRFREVMRGQMVASTAPDGNTRNMAIMLRAEILVDDLDAFLIDSNHRARLTGRVWIDGQGEFPAEGVAELFVIGERPGHRVMRYQASFSDLPDHYSLVGTKHVRPRGGLYVWHDVTTLYTALWRLGPTPQVVSGGIMKLSLWQGVRLLISLRGSGAGFFSGLSAMLRFVRFFLAEVIVQFVGWSR